MDYVAATSEIVGMLLVGNRSRHGFAVNIVGNAAWIFVAMAHGLGGLAFVSVVMAVVNCRNFLKWSVR